jgi:hypothetical protein
MRPDLHDGSLNGIIVSEGKTLELRCAQADGRRYVLRLPELVSLRADDFRQGNIILGVNIYESDFPADLIKSVYGEDGDADPAWLSREFQTLRQGGWTLLELTSSYGCHLLALARGQLLVEPAE